MPDFGKHDFIRLEGRRDGHAMENMTVEDFRINGKPTVPHVYLNRYVTLKVNGVSEKDLSEIHD
ncbi:MAG: hypothetical protein KBS59_05105 [Clostridiales bacterium]|nr:hypothetical protein [Clostridiales bacterium]